MATGATTVKNANTLNTTYIYFNVLDYTGNNVLSSFTLPQTPLTFVPNFTTSDILSTAGSISNKLIKWSLYFRTYSKRWCTKLFRPFNC